MWYKLNEDKTFTKVDVLEVSMDRKDRHVGYDELEDGTRISTVFLALDHSWNKEEGPILFETMIFTDNPKLSEYNEYQRRYKTWNEAHQAHRLIVDLIKSKL